MPPKTGLGGMAGLLDAEDETPEDQNEVMGGVEGASAVVLCGGGGVGEGLVPEGLAGSLGAGVEAGEGLYSWRCCCSCA